MLARGYDAMKKWIDYEKTFVKDGLISKDQYADWCVPPENPKLIHSQDPTRVTDKTLIASSYYYELLRQMARYARILDKPADAAEFDRLSAATQGRLPAALLQTGEQHVRQRHADLRHPAAVLRDGAGRFPPGGGRDAGAQYPTEERRPRGHGPGGRAVADAHAERQRAGDLAYKIATQKTYPGWGYMVEQGATTIWELWNGNTADPAMNSGNHVMQIGDLAVWMYEYLAGIRTDPEQPGFRHASSGRCRFRVSIGSAQLTSPCTARSPVPGAAKAASCNSTFRFSPNTTATVFTSPDKSVEAGSGKHTFTMTGY